MDLFGRKALAEARATINKLDRDNGTLAADVALYRYTVREMDELIFQISLLSDWPSQRPYFALLLEGTETRRKTESNRINEIILKELGKVG